MKSRDNEVLAVELNRFIVIHKLKGTSQTLLEHYGSVAISVMHSTDRRAIKTITITVVKRVKTLKSEYLDTMSRLSMSNLQIHRMQTKPWVCADMLRIPQASLTS